jgi:2-polyprenyl-3-methyl-5-hydroxy-6-metoxy-1,4-benzoquinol methylase
MPLIETTFAMCQSSVLLAAVELNLFTVIDRGDDTVESVAERTGCSVRGLRMIMDVLASMGFLEKDREHYALSPVAAKFLSTDSPSYLGGFVQVHHSEAVYGKWHQLAQTVRSGQPPTTTAEENDRFFAQLVDPLYVLSLPAAEVAAKVICAQPGRRNLRVLDIGAGSGVWSLALARRDSQTRVTVADLPSVIERVTRRFAAREGVGEQYDYLPGDFREIEFGESAYDVAILFRRIHRALKPGGQLLIAEIIPDEERREALFPLLFAVNMLVMTPEGNTFTMSEYRQWLEGAKFSEVLTVEAPSLSPLILARRS